MTVKCLKEHQKNIICLTFGNPNQINDLADHWGVSRRTIIRVLEEQGIDPMIKRRPRKAKEITQQLILAPREFTFPNAQIYPVQPKLNWFQRTLDHMVRRFALR
jgi:hypothetical protein